MSKTIFLKLLLLVFIVTGYSLMMVYVFHSALNFSTVTAGVASAVILVWLIRFPDKKASKLD
ncbi:MAG: hypothetical protein NTW29_18605 [Bacteroidetes bacterium]|nr:hypothetical protein [Bacteroidota bacterium]